MSEACKCYECGNDSLRTMVRNETFDFETGQVILTANAKGVPVQHCDRCGAGCSGPQAARKRQSATLDAVLAAYHELLEAAEAALTAIDLSSHTHVMKLRRIVNSLRRVP